MKTFEQLETKCDELTAQMDSLRAELREKRDDYCERLRARTISVEEAHAIDLALLSLETKLATLRNRRDGLMYALDVLDF